MRFAIRVACVIPLAIAASASAQAVDRRFAEEPTDGVAIPTTALAGEHDARATVANPGGLALVRGSELAVALTLEDSSVATASGSGFGVFAATSGGGNLLPRLGVGLGVEWLRPPRAQLVPDPGDPVRFTLAAATGLGSATGIGVSWHHFFGDSAARGLDAFDLGLSTRLGPYLAFGAGIRDLSTGSVAHAPVQRRYQAEAVVRPFGSEIVALAAGGRIGETRGDIDGWGRISVRAARGIYVVGAFESRALHALDDSPMGSVERSLRDARLIVGVELTLAQLGIAAFGSGIRDSRGAQRALGGGIVATLSTVPPPSVVPPADHIERVELSGMIGVRELTAIALRLRAMTRDASAKGVVVTFDGVDAGWATLQELRGELSVLRRAGKKVFAYMVSGTGRDYYVASAADKIYVDPAGGIRLVGMVGHRFYFRGAFDHVGVSPQFERIGEYKSAPEQFTHTAPTPIAARMYDELYDSLWSQWLAAVATGRHLSREAVIALVDNGPYTSGDLAKHRELVDAVATPEQAARLIAVDLGDDYGVSASPITRPERWRQPAIAIIYVDGDITEGESKMLPVIRKPLAGGETIAAALAAARSDPAIGAIVLRIDSPGGSALASELLAREVFATRKVKPIICSMSNLAASGGYYIAAGCDAIFAEPMTITGSIGIFYGKFDLSGLLKKLDINVNTVKRGQRADVDSLYRPYSDDERRLLMDKLRYMYDRFVTAVAQGRKLSTQAVDAAGRGHVYTGAQAQPLLLVDKFGGIADAIDDAKRRIGVSSGTSVELRELPKPPGSLFGVVGRLFGVREQDALPIDELRVFQNVLRGIGASLLVQPEGPQARLPYDVEFAD